MNKDPFDRYDEDEMDETGAGAPLRRGGDRRHRFFRFDPTFSTGILINLIGSLCGLGVAMSMMYSTYREDRTSMLKDIDQVRNTAQRDREDLRSAAQRDREDLKSGMADLRNDMKDMKADVRDVLRAQQQQQHR